MRCYSSRHIDVLCLPLPKGLAPVGLITVRLPCEVDMHYAYLYIHMHAYIHMHMYHSVPALHTVQGPPESEAVSCINRFW